MHVYSQETKARTDAELQPNIIIIYTSTLIQFYFDGLAPHTHIYTKPQRKESGDFPARRRVLLPRPQLRAPLAWSVSSSSVLRAGTCWPFDTTVWGGERTNGVFAATSARMGGGGIVDARGRERGMANAPSH